MRAGVQVGMNYWIGSRTYIYADLERTSGAKNDQRYRVSVGVRCAF